MYNGFFCTFCRDILPKKLKDVYVEAFTALKSKMLELGLTVDLEIFRFDFETALHKAAKEDLSVPKNRMLFFFHFSQVNWRNVVSLGFRQRYIEDLDFALKVLMLTALAFMPADKIYKGFQEVSMIMPEEFQDFLKYFEKTYVGMPKVVSNPGETIRLGWKDAKFVPSSWTIYERVLVGDPRTNNLLEGWHTVKW